MAAHGYGDRASGVEEMDSGGEREDPAQAHGSSGRRKKQMYRHTPQQIQELEAMFRVCPHPEDKQRAKMSRDLGLESRQIKFWFQNRRTLMKSQHEKADNCSLRAENDRIRSENISMKEAVMRLACRHCGLNNGSSANPYFDEQRLRMENARLKEEVDRVSNLTSKYLGRPIAHHHLPLPKPVPFDAAPSETLCNPRIDPSPSIPYYVPQISDGDKPMLMDMASYAMDEVIQLLQIGEPLWVKSASNGAEVLQLQAYRSMFPKPHQPKFSGTRTEASRESATVMMSCRMLIDAFMTASKWMELFPTMVSNATTIDIVASGASGSGSAGSAILMYQELQILSPAVPTRELCVLRHCRRVDPSSWAIADVSVDYLLGNYVEACTRKLPSGCLISEMANGCSKIIWVEHLEIKEKNPIHILFQHLVTSGAAFEARRWISNLHRTAERNAFSISAGIANDLGGVIPTPEAKQSMMKLAQRMVKTFCTTFSCSIANKWIMLSRPDDEYKVYFHKTDAARLAGGEIVSAATSVWLPLHAERLFGFLKDEQNRNLWEASKEEVKFQRVAHFINGSNSGNSISIFNRLKSTSSLLMLQESCTDASGSLLVYSPLGVSSLDMIGRGEDAPCAQLIVSGFTIVPDDGFSGAGDGGGPLTGSSSPVGGISGSLLTVGFQTVTNKTEGAEIERETVSSINAWVSHAIEKIKAALLYH